MSQALLVLSLWLHSLATVVLIGYFVCLSLVYLPYLSKLFSGVALGAALDEVSQRVRPWLGSSLLVFLISGAYLTFGDANYLGLGGFGNSWSVLMLVKHLLVLAMVGLWILLGMTLRGGLTVAAKDPRARFEPLWRVRLIIHGTSVCGALVLLLTVVAQVL